MENKKLGILLIILGILAGGIFIHYTRVLAEQSRNIGCFSNSRCSTLEKGLSFSHIGTGIFSFILALGFYLLFFNKTEKNIMDKLEDEKEKDKFDFALRMLNPFEAKVLRKVREQDGITQSTLRVRTDMSKAKLSYVLQDLEKRKIIKRVRKGKTLSIHLKV